MGEDSGKLEWYSRMFQYHPSPCKTEEDVAQVIADKTAELMPPTDFPRLLDLGCGDGLTTKKLLQKGYKAVGVTLGETNIKRAKDVHGINIYLCDMHNVPFPPDSFDAVLSNHSFEHSYAPYILVCEVRVLLRLKGRWLINLPHWQSKHAPITYHHPSVLLPEQFRQLFKDLAFNILKGITEEGKETYLDYTWLVEKDELTKCHSDIQRVLKARGERV